MTIQPAVKRETIRIAVGVSLLSVLMIAVFILLRKFDITVFLGALLGAAVAVGNFFLMALSVQKAADAMPARPAEADADDGKNELAADTGQEPPLSPEAQRAKKRMQLSYTLRMVGMATVGILGIALPCFNPYAVLLPLLFPRLVIFILGLTQNKRKEA